MVLLSRIGLPKSKGKAFKKQLGLVERLRKKSGIGYEMPALKDAYAGLMLHFAVTRERFYEVDKFYLQETQEKQVPKFFCWTQRSQSPIVLGPFGRGSLAVANIADVSLYADGISTAVVREL